MYSHSTERHYMQVNVGIVSITENIFVYRGYFKGSSEKYASSERLEDRILIFQTPSQ